MSDNVSPRFSTARLQLRALEKHNAPDMHKICNDYDVVKMTGTFEWPFNLAASEKRIAKMMALDPAHEQVFGIFLNASLIGTIGMHDPNATGQFELGYMIGKPWWGHGYATESVNGILNWAHKKWGAHIQISAGHFEDNPASGKVLEKAGFIKTGEMKMVDCAARKTKLNSIEYTYSDGGFRG